uniref:Uncharacterized protein n=1 Tax=Romanomermis culicivorax TaxID=13658 RepID=A0A915L0J0_ROMCU
MIKSNTSGESKNSVHAFYLATALNPKYKGKVFKNASTITIVKVELEKMVNDIATKNLTDQLTTPPRRKRIITPCSSKDWTQFVQGSSDDEEEACEEMNNKILTFKFQSQNHIILIHVPNHGQCSPLQKTTYRNFTIPCIAQSQGDEKAKKFFNEKGSFQAGEPHH